MLKKRLADIQNSLQDRKPQILGKEEWLKAAVMVPLIEKGNQLHLLFEVRSASMRSEPGIICFPGGKVDEKDADEQDAAVRETCEELGLRPQQINLFAALDFLITPYNSIIYPFVGTINVDSHIEPNVDEVAEVFYVPLDFFLSTVPERHDVTLQVKPRLDFPYHLIKRGKKYKWRTGNVPEYFYKYGDYVIWGLTARIILHFIELLSNDKS